MIEQSIVFHDALSFGTSTRHLVQRIKVFKKKSKIEIYTCRVRISFVGSKAELSRLCLWLLYIFFLSGKEIAITLQLIFARDAVRF